MKEIKKLWNILVSISTIFLFLVGVWNGFIMHNYAKGTFLLVFVLVVWQTILVEKNKG